MTDAEKAERVEYISSMIRGGYAKKGLTPDAIDDVIEAIRTNTDFSQMDLDIEAGMDPDEAYKKQYELKGYSATPSKRLNDALGYTTIDCPELYESLPPDVQWMYILNVRADVMRLHMSGSSYADIQKYGKLPSAIVEQEAELYTAIVDANTDNMTQSDTFNAARRQPRFTLDNSSLNGPMMPADVRYIYSTDRSLDGYMYENGALRPIAADYLQAAADQLRNAVKPA